MTHDLCWQIALPCATTQEGSNLSLQLMAENVWHAPSVGRDVTIDVSDFSVGK